MANLKTTMDGMYWDLDIASTQNLDGCAKSIPGQSLTLDSSRTGKVIRPQQLSLLSNGFPFGIIPCISPNKEQELGSFALQSLLLRPSFGHWWLGVVGQFRPKKLICNIKTELLNEDLDLSSVKDVAKHFLDKSLYALALCSHIPVTSSTSLVLSSEAHGERKGRRSKVLLFHKLPYHDISLNAAWPELFIDQKGRYWNVPESISLDCSSLKSESGLRYRFGVHKNSGQPQSVVKTIDSEAPVSLLPGICAKLAVSYEKSKDLWRIMETKEDLYIKTEKGEFRNPAYDERMKEPHATVSAIIGGTFGAWLQGQDKILKLTSEGDGDNVSSSSRKRNRVFADLFGSLCYTFQHGKFRKRYGDLTRVDARLDFSSASCLAKNIVHVFRKSSIVDRDDSVGLPRLGLIFQQQIAGPIVFRIDTKCVVDSPWKKGLQIEDFMYTLSYSLRLLQSGKVVAWYSPKRKEGMIELRVYEF